MALSDFFECEPLATVATSATVGKANPILAPKLERRIRAMARRWRYTDHDLRDVLELAAADPTTWLLAVDLDERRFGTSMEWPLQ